MCRSCTKELVMFHFQGLISVRWVRRRLCWRQESRLVDASCIMPFSLFWRSLVRIKYFLYCKTCNFVIIWPRSGPISSFRFHRASQAPEHGQLLLPGVPVVLPVGLPAAVCTPLLRLLPTAADLSTPGLPRQPVVRRHIRLQPQLPRLLPQFSVPTRACRERHRQPAPASAGAGRNSGGRGPVRHTPGFAEGSTNQSPRRTGGRRGRRGLWGILHYKQWAFGASKEGVWHPAVTGGTQAMQRRCRERACWGPQLPRYSFLQGKHQYAYITHQSSSAAPQSSYQPKTEAGKVSCHHRW